MANDVRIVLSAEDRTRSAIEGVLGRLDSMTSASALATRGLSALSAAFSVGAMVAWARATVDGIDALNDLQAATGGSIENISALEDVAKRTGTNFDTVSTALIKFNKVLLDAKPGSDAEAALQALNLNVKDLKALDPAEALRQTAVALAGFADDGNKGRLMLELFGKSTRDVAKFLQDLATKGELVATVTSQQAQEAERFNNQLSALQKNSTDAARAMVSDLLPSLNATIERFNLAKSSVGSFAQVLAMYFRLDTSKGFADNLASTEDQIKSLEDRRSRLTSDSAKLANERAIQTLKGQQQFLRELAIVKALENPVDAADAMSRRLRTDGGKPSLPATLGKGGGKTEPTKLSPADLGLKLYGDLLSQAGGFTANFAEQTSLLSAALAAGKIKVGDFSAAFAQLLSQQPGAKAALKATADLTDFIEQRFIKAENAAMDAAVKSALARQEARNKEAEGIRDFISEQEAAALATARKSEDAAKAAQDEFDAFGKTKSQLAELTLIRLQDSQASLSAGTVAYDAIQRQIDAQKQLIGVLQKGELRDAALDAADKAEKAWRHTADSINASLTDALLRGFESGKDFGQNFADTLENMLKTAILRPLLAKVLDPISLAVSGGINSLLSFDGGGYTGSGLRTGGLDGKGGFMAMLHPDETVTDHRKGGSAGPQQTVNVVQNFTVGDVASVSLVRQAVAGSERRIAASLSRSMNYGGAVA